MNRSNVLYLITLESLDTRYTAQWREFLPSYLESQLGINVIPIEGNQKEEETSDSAFLNFIDTNHYKNTQANNIVSMFQDGDVISGDYFLFLDAWNPTAHEIRYMSELTGIPVSMGAIWHAGSYDSEDFLGRHVSNKEWSYALERAFYYLYDDNFFATNFHMNMFFEKLGIDDRSKAIRTGFPFQYLFTELEPYVNMEKRDLVVFPHRLAPEKNPQMFSLLEQKYRELYPNSETEFCYTLKSEEITGKDEYHALMGSAKVVFSANKQETLGITTAIEGPILGVLPVVPCRLSYVEIFEERFSGDGSPEFVYSEDVSLDELARKVHDMVVNYELYHKNLQDYLQYHIQDYSFAYDMIEVISRRID